MLIDLLKAAVADRKVLAFEYDGQPRLVEPHALGLNKNRQLVLRAFQVTGGTATGNQAWKLFTLEKAQNLSVLDMASQAPRPGYKAGDKAMSEILQELPELIEGNGQYRAGFGRLVTAWFDTRDAALDAFSRGEAAILEEAA